MPVPGAFQRASSMGAQENATGGPREEARRTRKLPGSQRLARRRGAVRQLGAFVRRREELPSRTRARLGRDRRPERRRQAGPGDREQRRRHRLRAPEQGRRQLPGQAQLRHRTLLWLDRDRRPERRRHAGPGDRERHREHRLRASEQGRRQLPGQARLPNWTRARLGRDRRPERRRQAGPGDRERQRRRHRLRAPEQGRRQLPGQARLSDWTRPYLGRDRRPERRRQAGPGDRELQPRRHRLRAPEHAGPLHGAGRLGKDAAGREADDRARQLPRRQDPPRLLEVKEGLRDLGEAQARHGAAERRQGQPRRQPRKDALVTKLVSLASLPIGACSPRSFGLALVFVVSISLARGGPAAEPAPTADAGGTIVFQSTRDGDYDIYAVNPDGTGLTRLTDNKFEDSFPVPSPNGRLIAFYSHGITLMNADGTGRRKLRGCSGLAASGWSPDSTRLVCAASGTVTSLTRSGRHPSWSPDGRTIAFVDRERLWAIPADGGTRRRLSRRKVDEDGTPSWSPDSQRLAYAGSVGTNYRHDLFTIGADGSGERRLVQRISDLQTPSWSPEGSLIAFMKRLPHYGVAVYTVRTDGTGLERVSVSSGGESSAEPAWSADGTALLYTRWRYREAEDTDVFVITPGAGEGRAVTHPFPQGGTNEGPRWMTGPSLSGGEPAPRTITLPLARKLAFVQPLESVVTDGRRAVPYVHTGDSCTRVLVWDPITPRTVRTPHLCYSALGGFVLAGRRLAWAYVSEEGNTFYRISLATLRLPAGRPTLVTETIAYTEGEGESGDAIGNLAGHGKTIAFTSYNLGRKKKRNAWLLLARHGSKCPTSDSDLVGRSRRLCRRLAGAAGGVTTSVDAGRVLTVAPSGLVRLLSTRGRVLRTWRLRRGIVNARLRGRTLAVQHGVSLDVYDAATGAKRQTRPLASDEGLRPFLLDDQGDLLVYATGGAIHLLRLSDGRDVALDLPGAAPWLDARLEPRGLFVTWNQMYAHRLGRMAFVPLRTVIQGFDLDQSIRRPS